MTSSIKTIFGTYRKKFPHLTYSDYRYYGHGRFASFILAIPSWMYWFSIVVTAIITGILL